MADVRFNIFDFKKKVKWKRSIILYLSELFAFFLQFILITSWIGQLLSSLGIIKNALPKWITDLWMLLILVLQITILVFGQNFSDPFHNFYFWFAIYILADTFAATLRDVLLAPITHSGFIKVNNRQRWLLLTFLSVIHVILCFAILILCVSNQFNERITDSLTAVYLSTVIFLTLGDNAIHATGIQSKVMVLSELGYFLLFLALKFPMVVGQMKFVDYSKQEEENNNS